MPVLCATTASITLSALQTIDGVSVAAGNRVLVKNQTDQTTNGIYLAATGVWTRDADFDDNRDVTQGTVVLVLSGTTNGGAWFELTTASPSIGTSNLAFSQTFNPSVSSAMAPVISAATLAAARAAMGVPASSDAALTDAANTFTAGPQTLSGVALNEASVTLASASTVNIGGAAGNYVKITGTTTITAFDTVQAGTERELEFGGALTLTHNATSLILLGGANITTAAGDVAKFRSEGGGNWRCVKYTRGPASAATSLAGTDAVAFLTAAGFAGNKTLSSNGFYKFPGGLIVQWGQVGLTGSGTNSFTYPTAFPNNVFAVVATGFGGTGLTGVNINGTPSLSAATIVNTSGSSQTAFCVAIGN